MNSITPLEFFLYFILAFMVGMFILVQIANRTQQREQEQKIAAAGK